LRRPSAKKKAKSNFDLAFFNEAHLRCMKNEAGLCPMKRAFGTRRIYRALRFTAAKPSLHASVSERFISP